MSAAPPLPPSRPLPPPSPNGAHISHDGGPGGNRARPYAHIKDFYARADGQINPTVSIAHLLDRASNALEAAHTNLSFNRPDYAFTEFVVAQLIIAQTIPGIKGNISYLTDHPQREAQYKKCINRLHKEQDLVDRLKRDIEKDNQASGVRPTIAGAHHVPRPQSHGLGTRAPTEHGRYYARPQSVQPPPRSDSRAQSQDSSKEHRYSVPPTTKGHNDGRPSASRDPDSRPIVQAKPPYLQGPPHGRNDVSQATQLRRAPEDPLLARFSGLRIESPPNEAPQPPKHAELPRTVNTQSAYASKEMPKLPSPTYSPAKVIPDDMPLKSSQRNRGSITSTSETNSLASSSSLPYRASQDVSERRNGADHPTNGSLSSQGTVVEPRRRVENMPQETEINAQRLYDYLQAFNILLIDVRSREKFDEGHVFVQNIVCVEPAALRPNKSAEELQEALVLAPEHEYDLFSRRHEFDLVVYYDDRSNSAEFLSHSAEHSPLRCLHDSLYHYNADKPLQWQPILLLGGLEAWTDLAGPQSLQTSNTAGQQAQGAKLGRPIARRPLVSNNSRLGVNRKRHRDYNPLAPEEEQKWRERARSGSVVVQLPQRDIENNDHSADDLEARSTGTETAFHQRYPDVASVESQVNGSRPPTRPAPDAPRVPSYPEPPLPTVPSRPPPALPRPSYSGVSERVVSNNSVTTTASSLAPYVPQKLLRLPRTGLHNFGVTCFMNATIQCLSATLPLTIFFLEAQYKKYMQRENWKGSKGIMPELYNTLLSNIWRPGDADTIRPTNFKKFCARLNREWNADRQQDAKEFLDFLLDTLHEDLNVNWNRSPLRPLNSTEEANRERTPAFLASKHEFDRYLHRDSSKITELFAGQHISRLQCTTCRFQSTTYETFYSISVEIPRPAHGGAVSIDDCLRSYTTSEVLAGDEVWRCPNCKRDREATKRITITRAPQYLVIHFKRFSSGHGERARKVHTPVEFPLQGLDLSRYVLPPPDPRTAQYIDSKYGSKGLEAPIEMTPPYRYDAYAVTRHIGGTMTSGHYISLVEDQARGRWREFNDDVVNDFHPEHLSPSKRLQNDQAYIVFYRRVWS